MSSLRISLFGPFEIFHPDYPQDARLSRTSQVLFAFLLLKRSRPQPRELLANLLWGEKTQEQARSCLNTALWRLRGTLEPEGVPHGKYLIANSSGEISFNFKSEYWLDVQEFEDHLITAFGREAESLTMLKDYAEDGSQEHLEVLENVVKLYKGDLLEGFYDDWALSERERLRALFLSGLSSLMRIYKKRGDFERSLAYGQQILSIDPLHEDIHREVIRLYAQNGQRSLAIRQYKTCRELLAEELGIAPMPETQAIYQQIIFGSDPPGQQFPAASMEMANMLNELRRSIHGFDQARQNLEIAIQLLEQASQKFSQHK